MSLSSSQYRLRADHQGIKTLQENWSLVNCSMTAGSQEMSRFEDKPENVPRELFVQSLNAFNRNNFVSVSLKQCELRFVDTMKSIHHT